MSSLFRSLSIPVLALCALAAGTADAGSARSYKNKVVWVGVNTNYTGAYQMVDGVKVYTEGEPHLVINILGTGGHTMTFSVPTQDGKAATMLELAKLALTTGKELTATYSLEQKSYRLWCVNFDAKGCVELSTPDVSYALVNLQFI